MTKKNRRLALLLAVALVFAMLFSFLFIARNAHHDCLQEDCVICQQLEACETLLHGTALVAVAVALCAFLSRGKQAAPVDCGGIFPLTSLITLKVKLSN